MQWDVTKIPFSLELMQLFGVCLCPTTWGISFWTVASPFDSWTRERLDNCIYWTRHLGYSQNIKIFPVEAANLIEWLSTHFAHRGLEDEGGLPAIPFRQIAFLIITITGFLTFVHRLVFWKLENKVSETRSVSILRWGVQWVRLALRKGPNWAGVFHPH
jgi:hypothetical protein